MKLYILIITGLLWLSGILTPAYAAQPVLKHNLPDMSSDIASINIWKPEIPMLSPAKVAAEDELPEYIGDMLTFAHKFTGLRYRRGGKTPKGFDCSGFTSYVYRQFGISLNASSRSQYTQGTSIDTDNLRPGDLVFFGGRGGSRKIVGHVGIVASVNYDNCTFDFIHSACSSGITVSKSTEPYYSRRYIGARRVTK